MATPHVRSLLEELTKNGKTLEAGQDDAARKAMIEAAGKLILALEGPGEMLTRIGWGEVRFWPFPLFPTFWKAQDELQTSSASPLLPFSYMYTLSYELLHSTKLFVSY